MSLYPSFEGLTIGKEVIAQKQPVQSERNEMSIYPVLDVSTSELDVDSRKRMVQEVLNNGPLRANYNQLASLYLGIDFTNLFYDEYGNLVYPGFADHNAAVNTVAVRTSNVPAPEFIEAINKVREIKVSKAKNGKVGLQLRGQDGGVFVTYVEAKSPAARAGLRFGDQVLQIHDQLTANLTGTKAMNLIKNGPSSHISIIIRGRPLDRVFELTKNCDGDIGVKIEDGKITGVNPDSSAASNGVLTNHQLLEVDGINVIGLKDDCIQGCLLGQSKTVCITVMPSFFFDKIVEKLGRCYLENMDRSQPVV